MNSTPTAWPFVFFFFFFIGYDFTSNSVLFYISPLCLGINIPFCLVAGHLQVVPGGLFCFNTYLILVKDWRPCTFYNRPAGMEYT